MKLRTRVRAIIIQNNRVLFLGRNGYPYVWTPGGKIEDGESDEQTLRRELKEELGAELKEFKFYKEYVSDSVYHPNCTIRSRFYLVSIEDEIKVLDGLEGPYWVSKEDIESKRYPFIPVVEKEVLVKLIEEGLLK